MSVRAALLARGYAAPVQRRLTITTLDADLNVLTSAAFLTDYWDTASTRACLEAAAAHAGSVQLRADFDPRTNAYVWGPRRGDMPAFVDVQVTAYAAGSNQPTGSVVATFALVPTRNGYFRARRDA